MPKTTSRNPRSTHSIPKEISPFFDYLESCFFVEEVNGGEFKFQGSREVPKKSVRLNIQYYDEPKRTFRVSYLTRKCRGYLKVRHNSEVDKGALESYILNY